MKEQIKKWVRLIAECMVLGFAITFGMGLCTLLFDAVIG